MTQPPPIPPKKADSHKTVFITIGLAIIGVLMVIAEFAIALFLVSSIYSKVSSIIDRARIDEENEKYYAEVDRSTLNSLAAGVEFQVMDSKHTIGDNYTFRFLESEFVPVPENAVGVKPFTCRIDQTVPDRNGRVSVLAENGLKARFSIDSLIADSEKNYQPLQLHFAGAPDRLATATYIDADLYNHTVADTVDFHSCIALIKGYLFNTGKESDTYGMPAEHEHDESDHIYSFTVPDDSFVPIPQGTTGMKDFVSGANNVILRSDGRIMIGAENARAWLNIDSLITRGVKKEFVPVQLGVKGFNRVLTITDLSVKTGSREQGKRTYSVTAKGYVFDKQTIKQQQ